MRAIILDTETTGLLVPGAPLEQQPKIIELAMLVVHDGEIVDRFEWLFNPGHPLDPQITKITGLTDADLVGKPGFELFHKSVSFVLMGADLIVAHNAPFDIGMLENEFKRVGTTPLPIRGTVECTVQNYFHLFGRRPRLTELYEKIMGKPLVQTHRAMDDCRALYEILVKDEFFLQPLQPTTELDAHSDGPPIQLTTSCFTGALSCDKPASKKSSPKPLPAPLSPEPKALVKKCTPMKSAKKSEKPSASKSKGKKTLPKRSSKALASRKPTRK